MKQTKSAASRCVFLRLWAMGLGLWFAAMSLLTWTVAADFQIQIRSQTQEIAAALPPEAPTPDDLPGLLQARQIDRLGDPYLLLLPEKPLPFLLPARPNSMSNHSWLWGKWNLVYGFEAAVVFPGEPSPIATGQLLTMHYTTAENWEQGNQQPLGVLQVDIAPLLDQMPEAAPDNGLLVGLLLPLVRMRGTLDGNRFVPLSLERQMDGRWSQLWGDPAADAPDTVYGWEVSASIVADQPVKFDGVRYDSLSDLLQASLETPFSCDRRSLREGIVQAWAPDNAATVAVRCWPLAYAVTRMLPLSLTTLALCVLLLALLQRRLQKNLFRPLTRLRQAAEKGTTVYPCASWQPVFDLETHFSEARQAGAAAEAQIQKLTASLDYAQDAEQKRRELISRLTHQLKNPLAVIHSYAEALQADIQAGKREQYLAVIQEESDKMDEIVLQMLDFSRLEAGKVQLSVQTFSLEQLIAQTAEEFRPLMEEKQLKLTVQTEAPLLIAADEGRMAQVLSNLLSNAVKYTPAEGEIRIQAGAGAESIRFSIENTAPALQPEEVAQLFDSFYRTASAAAIPGTGLGLAIVKSIIALHGGRCHARSRTLTAGGSALEIGFTLPVRP